MLWLKILKYIRPVNLTAALNLIISPLIDVPLYAVYTNNLVSLISGMYYIPKYGVHFVTRSRSDDLYYMIPGREGIIEKFILKSLEEGDVFVDVGANIGFYTILAAKRVGNNGLIVSLEPIPDTVKIMKLNCKLNNLKNVIVVEKAAWDKPAQIKLRIPLIAKLRFYGLASPYINVKYIERLFEGGPLDSILKYMDPHIEEIKMIKIDAEGAEEKIVNGALESFGKTKFLYIECRKEKEEIVKRVLQDMSFKCLRLEVPHAVHLLCRKVR